MAAFNVVQKRRRAAVANRKRQIHGDASSGKLHQRAQPQSVSGKRQRKMLRKWRREQKEAVEKGLITMQDVEMAVADETVQDANKPPIKFPMKKSSKLKVTQLKKKGKNKKNTKKSVGETSLDSMVE